MTPRLLGELLAKIVTASAGLAPSLARLAKKGRKLNVNHDGS
jgi:hypothetical protein